MQLAKITQHLDHLEILNQKSLGLIRANLKQLLQVEISCGQIRESLRKDSGYQSREPEYQTWFNHQEEI